MRRWKTNQDMLSTLNLPVINTPFDSRLRGGNKPAPQTERHMAAPKYVFGEQESEDDPAEDEVVETLQQGPTFSHSNKRLQKLERELALLNGDEAENLKEEELQVIVYKEVNIRDLTKIKRIQPNSTIEIFCEKGLEQFFKLTFTGWKFPLIFNFNMNVKVDIYISFTAKKPGPDHADYKHLKQSVIKQDWPTKEQCNMYNTMNICILPLCSFHTNLSIKFDGKDYSNFKRSIVEPRKFNINYHEAGKFSRNFISNKQFFAEIKEARRAAAKSRLSHYNSSIGTDSQIAAELANVAIARHYKDYKDHCKNIFFSVMDKKREVAKLRADFVKKNREKLISEKIQHKYNAIAENELILDLTLSALYKKTQTKLLITNLYLFKVLSSMWQEFEDKPGQTHLRFEKAAAPNTKVLSKYFKSLIQFSQFAFKCSRFVFICRKILSRFRRTVQCKQSFISDLRVRWEAEIQNLSQIGRNKKINDLIVLPNKSILKDKQEIELLFAYLFDCLLFEHMEKSQVSSKIDFDKTEQLNKRSRFFRAFEYMTASRKTRTLLPPSGTQSPKRPSTILMTSAKEPPLEKPRQEKEELKAKSLVILPQKRQKFSAKLDDLDVRCLLVSFCDLETRVAVSSIMNSSQSNKPKKSSRHIA